MRSFSYERARTPAEATATATRRPGAKFIAGAALAVVAALLGAGEMQVLAQHIEQRSPRVERDLAHPAVHIKSDIRYRRRCSHGVARRRGDLGTSD